MILLNPLLLIAISAIAIPVIIHLLNNNRYKVEPFGAMMFLRKAVKQRAQTIKIQQLILLCLRCLFFIFLAIAFSRPVSNVNAVDSDEACTHIIIIDNFICRTILSLKVTDPYIGTPSQTKNQTILTHIRVIKYYVLQCPGNYFIFVPLRRIPFIFT